MNPVEAVPGVHRIGFFDPAVVAGFSGRNFGNARREEFLTGLGVDPHALVMVGQVHGGSVLVVQKTEASFAEAPADGLVTSVPGIVLGIRTADCVPVFFHDPIKKVVGIAHGGWRGVKDGIISRMLNILERRFGTRMPDLKVALGPSLRKCCYEVGNEFLGYFPGFYHAKNALKGNLDLAGVIRARLVQRGVPEAGILDTGICTVCENKNFFSYRAEKETRERTLNVISLVG